MFHVKHIPVPWRMIWLLLTQSAYKFSRRRLDQCLMVSGRNRRLFCKIYAPWAFIRLSQKYWT